MLTVLTINYNGAEKTIKLLESLKNQTNQDFKVIVLDNASDSADYKKLQTHCTMAPFVQLIKNNENFGFSGGCNIGIKKAIETGADWILLLNNDTWVESDFMVSLMAKLSQLDPLADSKQGIVGIPLVENDHVAYCGKIEWLKPTLEHIYSVPTVRHRKTDNYAIGGGVAVHKEVFEKIGLLNEKYFLYFEDVDFSLRAQKAGFKLIILEEPKAYHQVSASTKKLGPSLLLRYHYRNALYFNLKNGSWYIKLAVWPWSWIIAVKQLIKIVIKQNLEQSRAILKGVADFYKHKMGKI